MMSVCSKIPSLLNWIYRRLKLKYAVPFIILFLYTLFGAGVLFAMENPTDQAARKDFRQKLRYAKKNILGRLVEIKFAIDIFENDTAKVHNRTEAAIMWYQEYLGVDVFLKEKGEPSPWTWWGAMFFAGTIYSTIAVLFPGYGRPYPATSGGQVFTCLYALVGIPLFLVILKEVGKHLSRILRRCWKRSLRFRRKAEVTEETSRHTKLPFPMTLPLVLVFLWIFLCAAVFCIWETEWTYFESVYFVFISLSTIGLGDLVPSKPDLMLANFILIVIGLALISMTFNIIQIRLEEMMEDMLQQFIDDFERLAASSGKHGLEIGMSSPLAALPLQSMGQKRRGLTASKWLATKLMQQQRKRRLSDTESSEGEEDPTEEVLPDSMKRFASDHPAGSLLLSRAMEDSKLQKLKHQIEAVSVAIQTENDFTELLHFLEIPKKEMDSQTEISFSTSSRTSSISSLVRLTSGNSRPSSRRSSADSLTPVPNNSIPEDSGSFNSFLVDESTLPSSSDEPSTTLPLLVVSSPAKSRSQDPISEFRALLLEAKPRSYSNDRELSTKDPNPV